MHTTVQHRRAANTLASTPFATSSRCQAITGQHGKTLHDHRVLHASSAARCRPSARCPNSRSGCWANLLLPMFLRHGKAIRSNPSGRGRRVQGSGSRRVQSYGSLRVHLSQASQASMRSHRSPLAWSACRWSWAERRGHGQIIPAARTSSAPSQDMLKVAG